MRKNSPNPFANLSDAEIRRLAAELRDALRPLRDEGAVQPLHAPFTGQHAHAHSDFGGGSHSHVHSHDGDADHDHEHTAGQQEATAGRQAHRRQRGQQAARQYPRPGTVLNSARRPGQGNPWEELAKLAREIESSQSRRGQR